MIINIKFMPPTNTLGARWKATVISSDDRSLQRTRVEPYDHANPQGQAARLAIKLYLQSELGREVAEANLQAEMDALGVVFMSQETAQRERIVLITRKHTYLAPTGVVPA